MKRSSFLKMALGAAVAPKAVFKSEPHYIIGYDPAYDGGKTVLSLGVIENGKFHLTSIHYLDDQ